MLTDNLALMKKAMRAGRLGHALLFTGPAGAGQEEAALQFAKSLFCAAKASGEPCGSCRACRLTSQKAHPDLHCIRTDEGSSVIKVEGIRELRQAASLKPYEAAAKLFVIEDADRMNDAAQNAVLKTLEEPEGPSYFILITSHPDKLEATIRSRTQVFRFFRAETENRMTDEARRAAAQALESRGAEMASLDREGVAAVLDALIGMHRDALLCRIGAADGPSVGPVGRLSAALDEDALCGRIEMLSEYKERIRENANIKVALANLWASLET